MNAMFGKFSALSCAVAFCALGYTSQGAEYIGTGTVNWTDVVSSAGVQTGSSLTIYNSSSTAGMSINNVNGDVELGDLNLSYIGAPTKASQVTLRITEGEELVVENLNISNRSLLCGGALSVKGDLLINTTNDDGDLITALGQNDSGNLEKLTVGGNFKSTYVSSLWGREGVMIAAWDNSRSTQAYNAAYWDDPDISIGGKFESAGVAKIYTSLQMTGKYTTNVYAKFGSLVGNEISVIEVMVNSNSAKERGVLNLMITGSGADYEGGEAVFQGSLRPNSIGGIHLFMNSADGTLVQKMTGTPSFFDGLTMMNGTLLLNFKSESAGSNHGDLEMQGGAFGSSNTAGGTFAFKDVVYKSGKIILALDSAGAFDALDLSGTVKFADGVSGVKVEFDFGDNLAWLVDSAENDGKGVKVISWAEQSSIGDDGFTANRYTGEDIVCEVCCRSRAVDCSGACRPVGARLCGV